MPPTTAARWMTTSGRAVGERGVDRRRASAGRTRALRGDEDVGGTGGRELARRRAAEEAGAAGDHDAAPGQIAVHAVSAPRARRGGRRRRRPRVEVGREHQPDQLVERRASASSRAARAALDASPQQLVDLGRAEVARVDPHVAPPSRGRPARTRPRTNSRTRVHLAGRDDVVVRLGLLEHQPHRLDVLRRVAPVAPRVEVAEVQRARSCPLRIAATPRVTLRVTNVPPRRGDSWLNRMPLRGMHPVRLAVVDRHPVGEDLGDGVRAARVERRRLALRRSGDLRRTSRELPAW